MAVHVGHLVPPEAQGRGGGGQAPELLLSSGDIATAEMTQGEDQAPAAHGGKRTREQPAPDCGHGRQQSTDKESGNGF